MTKLTLKDFEDWEGWDKFCARPLTEEDVVALMKSSSSQEEWNENCSYIKQHFDGYPSFWGKVMEECMGWNKS